MESGKDSRVENSEKEIARPDYCILQFFIRLSEVIQGRRVIKKSW